MLDAKLQVPGLASFSVMSYCRTTFLTVPCNSALSADDSSKCFTHYQIINITEYADKENSNALFKSSFIQFLPYSGQ